MIISKKYFFVIVIALLACGNLYAQSGAAADKKLRREIVGIWHSSPYIASGMNDNYQFFADGTFRFNYNQMILSKRTISYGGKWEISRGKLNLSIAEKTDLVGGKKVKSGISADGFEIEGGRRVTSKINPPTRQTKTLSPIRQDELYKVMTIGGVKYWRLSTDPKAYEN